MEKELYQNHVHISSKHHLLDLKLKEVWQYRELIGLFVGRNFTVSYKQTILGPVWIFVSPLITSLIYVILFGNIARLGTDGIPMLLFYLSGNAIWTYFSACVSNNANTFTGNANLFGKVYFPRLTVPIANMLMALTSFGLKMILVLLLLAYYLAKGAVEVHFLTWLALPFVLLWLGIMGMSIGIIVSSITTKYRDLAMLVSYGIQLWMYVTPVVYPLSTVSHMKFIRMVTMVNPVTMPIEIFRYCLLGSGTILPLYSIYSMVLTLVLAFIGIIIFNKVERTFMDTV